MEHKKHTSLKDIAGILGVSIPTISRALKDSPEISRELCAKAKKLAKEMNYRPNPFAMSLRRNAPRIIGVIVPDIVTHFFSSILSGIEDTAVANGYFVIITTSHESYEHEKRSIENLVNMRVEGIIACLSQETTDYHHFTSLSDINMPVVLFDRVCLPELFSTVVADGVCSAQKATQHLLDNGSGRVAFIYDVHYQYLASQRTTKPLDGKGKLVLYPSTGCETYKMAYNSANTIGALKCVTNLLLQLPEPYLSAEEREHWKHFYNRIPDIPFRICEGKRTIAPAVVWERISNVEIPQLYPVYPWGLYGIGLPELETAVNTWKYGIDNADQKQYKSWHQDAIFCARLGLTEEAKEITLKKMTDAPRRYPTFWGPGHDWVPDHNWGGSGMIGVQEMLMQTVGEKIYLLPAWPKEWNVDFKLHAPDNTVVECSYKNGKIIKLDVLPTERKDNVVIM